MATSRTQKKEVQQTVQCEYYENNGIFALFQVGKKEEIYWKRCGYRDTIYILTIICRISFSVGLLVRNRVPNH